MKAWTKHYNVKHENYPKWDTENVRVPKMWQLILRLSVGRGNNWTEPCRKNRSSICNQNTNKTAGTKTWKLKDLGDVQGMANGSGFQSKWGKIIVPCKEIQISSDMW